LTLKRYSGPVRAGNAASMQHQVDVLGEVIDCLHLARRGGISASQHEAAVKLRIVEHLEKAWHTEGSGIWESRGPLRQYTYSKVRAWAAFDRFVAEHAQSQGAERRTCARLAALHDRVHWDFVALFCAEAGVKAGASGRWNTCIRYLVSRFEGAYFHRTRSNGCHSIGRSPECSGCPFPHRPISLSHG
jgi:GH15 family glucan-1,4-alpha-glucosidase